MLVARLFSGLVYSRGITRHQLHFSPGVFNFNPIRPPFYRGMEIDGLRRRKPHLYRIIIGPDKNLLNTLDFVTKSLSRALPRMWAKN